MRIVDARVVVCCPGRNFVTLKITTEDGVSGLGDATLNGRELAVASYLEEHVVPLLIGRDARRIEDTWQYLYKGAYWRRGPVTMTAIAAVDTALWDIKAKAGGLPRLPAAGRRLARRRAGLRARQRRRRGGGGQVAWRSYLETSATRRCASRRASPASSRRTASARGGHHYEPAEKGRAAGERLEHRALPRLRAAGSSRACGDEFGPDLHLLHDVPPPPHAHRGRAPRQEPRAVPTSSGWRIPPPAELQEGFRLIRQHTTTPLAVGEVFNSVYDCQQLIQEQLIDYIRATVVHAGGITHLRKIAASPSCTTCALGSHGATDLSPVCMAAALHFDLAVHNFGIQEYMPHIAGDRPRLPARLPVRGRLSCTPARRPGWASSIDEALAARHPYRRAYLPINRRLDGTMHDW